MLSAGGTVTAGSVNVLDGTLSLAGATKLSTTGSISLGDAGNASGAISLVSGATLSTVGGLSINSGSLTDAGGLVTVGGALTVGTAGSSASGVTAGGKLTVAGGITETNGIVFAGGAGSKLVANGTLTAAGGNSYPYSSNSFPSFISGSVAARDGGVVQLGGLVLNAPQPGTFSFYSPDVSVDSTSTIEIGTAGGAAVGAITIDAGKTATSSATASFSGSLVDNGILSITGGMLTQNGSVSGSGLVQIGKNATWVVNGTVSGSGVVQIGKDATWVVNGSVAATDTIAFLDTGAALSIGTSFSYTGTASVSAPYSINATITGFQTGDSIILAQPVSTATYTAGAGTNPGTLVLSNATGTVETLHLAGNFTGKTFFLSPTTTGGASVSLLSQAAQGSGPKSANSDSYTWIGSSGGSWGALGNWNDTTTGTNPASYVPGTLTPVTIAGPTGSTFEVITGGGAAASVGLTGNVSLAGSYAVGGAVTVGSMAVVPSTPPYLGTTTTLTPGTLMLSAGGTVTAGSVNVLDGTLSLAGATKLSTTGSISLGDAGNASGAISLVSGATLSTVGDLSINFGSLTDAGGLVTVGGALTVGTAGSSASGVTAGGKLTVAGGITETNGIVFAGGASSKLVANGTLTAAGGNSYPYSSNSFPFLH